MLTKLSCCVVMSAAFILFMLLLTIYNCFSLFHQYFCWCCAVIAHAATLKQLSATEALLRLPHPPDFIIKETSEWTITAGPISPGETAPSRLVVDARVSAIEEHYILTGLEQGTTYLVSLQRQGTDRVPMQLIFSQRT